MSKVISFSVNTAMSVQIAGHLRLCDAMFVPPLSERLDIDQYAEKLAARAVRFEAWSESALVGLVAVYCNDACIRTAFVSSVSVLPAMRAHGIGSKLMSECINYVRRVDYWRIELEVDVRNGKALSLYTRCGFVPFRTDGNSVFMSLDIERGL
jgi:GNAT superfamily N-acetyltransferase